MECLSALIFVIILSLPFPVIAHYLDDQRTRRSGEKQQERGERLALAQQRQLSNIIPHRRS